MPKQINVTSKSRLFGDFINKIGRTESKFQVNEKKPGKIEKESETVR